MIQKREESKKQKKLVLLDNAKGHQQNLYNDLNSASERVVVFGKNALVISGVIYVGFTILDRFLEAKLATTERKKDPGKFDSLNKIILPLLAFALQQGSLALMKKARLMLVEYLEKQDDVQKG